MSTLFQSPGAVVNFTNGTGVAIVVNTFVDLGYCAGLATTAVAINGQGNAITEGVVNFAKANNVIFTSGARLYYDSANARVTITPTPGLLFVGFCLDGAAETATVCAIKLAPYSDQGVRQLALAAVGTLTVQDFAGGGVYLVTNSTTATFAVTLPLAAAIGGGKILTVRNSAGTNAVTLTRAGSDTINGATTFATIDAVNDRATFFSEVGLGYSLLASTIA